MATPRRVLVADDDPEVLDAVANALESDGAEVHRASSGAELIERLAEDAPYDLIVTDVSMPWMSGVQVAHSARTAGLETPIVVITALKSIDAQKLRGLGNKVALLHKPFDLAQLRAAIESLFEKEIGAGAAK